MNKLICIGLIVVIIIILIYFKHIERNIINGYWLGTDDFCEDAELEDFLFYINGSNGYIIATNAEGVIFNNKVKVSLSRFGLINKKMSYSLTLDWYGEDPDEDVFPKNSTLILYPYDNKIEIMKGDVAHAILKKYNE